MLFCERYDYGQANSVYCSFDTYFFAFSACASAKSPREILDENQSSIVYLSVRQTNDNAEVSHGTGFIVTRDGYFLSAAHVAAQDGQYLDAVIGGKEGVHHSPTFVGSEPSLDIALWRFQQAVACRPTVPLSTTTPEATDAVLVIGFPGALGLSPSLARIGNVEGPDQEYVLDGTLEEGDSGGPTFNESGEVIGIFRGGHPASGTENHVIPIGPAVALLGKYGVSPSNASADFGPECYSKCRNPENGVERWHSSVPWSASSGWLNGGHSRQEVCGELQASWVQTHPGHAVVIQSMSESNKKDILGHVTYQYSCVGTDVSSPVYREARTKACGLWSRTGD